jgi:hypothetical protein
MFNPFGFQPGGLVDKNGNPISSQNETIKANQIRLTNILKDCFHWKVIQSLLIHSTESMYRNLESFAEEHRN